MDREKSGEIGIGKERKSNLELLRIVSMILIVTHHYAVHGGFLLPNINFNRAFVQVLSLGGKLGVDCFVLISGYFMIHSHFRLEKAVKLWAQIWFYSIGFMAIFYGFGIFKIQIDSFIRNLFPVVYAMYWFATTYLVLYVLTLFLNPAIKAMSRKKHLILIWILAVLWTVFPTFMRADLGYSTLGLFIFLYLTGAYFRLYPSKKTNQCTKSFLFGFAMYAIVIAYAFLVDFLSVKYPQLSGAQMYLAGENKVPTVLCAIGLFLGFKNWKMGYHPWINRFASSMFAVYLIQENYFVNQVLWKDWLQSRMYSWSSKLWIHAIISTVIVILGAVVIDQLRIFFIEKPLFSYLRKKKLWERLEQKLHII